ncbi:MAG TPA: DUF2600 family protein [Clostridiaceae bacterium]|nr:DUF2600 family protein [Clostridiaceae bacterium]
MADSQCNLYGSSDYSKLLLTCFIKVFPKVDREIKSYINILKNDDMELLYEQLAEDFSEKKTYFREGSLYAIYPGVKVPDIIKIIVPLNFLCYYLDNLCNLSATKEEANFRQMYTALLDITEPERLKSNYFKYNTVKKKSDLLNNLVDLCRNQLKTLPSYNVIKKSIIKFINYYIDIQVYKHMNKDLRDDLLKTWADNYTSSYPEIYWWEFASSSESLFGIFSLIAAAYDPNLSSSEVNTLVSVYFPWICGLHSLLNHYINYQEHFQLGKLNYTYYYRNLKQCEERLSFFIDKSLLLCTKLKHGDFHATVIKALIAAYLSDPRASFGMNKLTSSKLLIQPPPPTGAYYKVCQLLRYIKAI